MKRILLFLICMLLSSCSNYRELNNLAAIISVGVDKGKEDGYRVTFQVVNPGQLTKTGGNSPGLPLINYPVEGETLNDAYRKSSSIIPREIITSHLSLLIIGEEQAREGIYPLLDSFERAKQTRSSVLVFIARGMSAEEVLEVVEPIESNPTKSIISTTENNKKLYGIGDLIPVYELVSMFSSEGKAPIITGISHSKPKEGDRQSQNLEKMTPSVIEVDGIGIFKDDRLVRWIDGEQARIAQMILSESKSTTFPFSCSRIDSGSNKEKLTLTTRGISSTLTTKVKNSEILLTIDIVLPADISDFNCNMDLEDPKTIERIEKTFEDEVKSQINQVMETVQKEQTDVFGFGEKLSKSDPKYWEKHKKEWDDLFSKASFSININSKISNTGMRTNTFKMK
ncbi:Ger(x)C family spore germination protein [Metabacillus halosaccharovorans]|uniref:Ger(X)C family spore germination protein n=1 Tax=Metabacillus halosaccharovorans TaxID=930124 RepID=A0ABT3DH63_9BACI|nr:Ger(x)C family spore germination protein [Metabacillus halosaccharovorans]MCV9886322.1 Ger(x)C family spore germination protein [Metabacillus halosaccharovorans]